MLPNLDKFFITDGSNSKQCGRAGWTPRRVRSYCDGLAGNAIRGSRALDRSSPCSSEDAGGPSSVVVVPAAAQQTGRMNRSIDFRSDLYALGVTFCQMLTGPLPFTGSYVKSASSP